MKQPPGRSTRQRGIRNVPRQRVRLRILRQKNSRRHRPRQQHPVPRPQHWTWSPELVAQRFAPLRWPPSPTHRQPHSITAGPPATRLVHSHGQTVCYLVPCRPQLTAGAALLRPTTAKRQRSCPKFIAARFWNRCVKQQGHLPPPRPHRWHWILISAAMAVTLVPSAILLGHQHLPL